MRSLAPLFRVSPKLLGLCSVALLVLPSFALGADLKIFPRTANFEPGEEVELKFLISSPDEPINAIQGTVSVPSFLGTPEFTFDESIIDIWLFKPHITDEGTIDFAGGVFYPGFQGGERKLFTAVFLPHATGTGSLSFVNGTVLANDGRGSDVTGSLEGSVFSIGMTNLFDVSVQTLRYASRNALQDPRTLAVVFLVLAALMSWFILWRARRLQG